MELQPTPVSRHYTVKIAHQPPFDPDVEVLAPILRLHRDAKGLPHVYPGNRLCLYEPGEWKSNMLLASTVLPWAIEWLYYYEIWLAIGEWTGGGDWPGVQSSAPLAAGSSHGNAQSATAESLEGVRQPLDSRPASGDHERLSQVSGIRQNGTRAARFVHIRQSSPKATGCRVARTGNKTHD
ncbi:hypothetical protein [Amycolatopsis xylanica]|uniref:hypothetical protein n=1 Tax=Amycolatopsis xylanica TaxID=589385 RepID=UPI0015A0442A|nr:hypothetical protein [Amycolatopsis xylanica]